MQDDIKISYPLVLQGFALPNLLASKHFKWKGVNNKADIIDKVICGAYERWFFVDHAYTDIQINHSFICSLWQDKIALMTDTLTIKILYCFEQFGNLLPNIPRGWKTICKIEFSPEIPVWINKLKYLDEWQYNPSSVTLYLNINQ